LVKKDPGIFYLCIDEFKRFFSLLSVCYVEKNFKTQCCYNIDIDDDKVIFMQFNVSKP